MPNLSSAAAQASTERRIVRQHPFKQDYSVLVKVTAKGRLTPLGKFKTDELLERGWGSKSKVPKKVIYQFELGRVNEENRNKFLYPVTSKSRARVPWFQTRYLYFFGHELKKISKNEAKRLTEFFNQVKLKQA